MTEEEAKTNYPVLGMKMGHSKGYKRLLSPNHPNANADGYVYEHRYVKAAGITSNEVDYVKKRYAMLDQFKAKGMVVKAIDNKSNGYCGLAGPQ